MRTATGPSLRTLLDGNLTLPQLSDMVVFVGAGASVDAPSLCPTWNALRDGILAALLAKVQRHALLPQALSSGIEGLAALYHSPRLLDRLAMNLVQSTSIRQWSRVELGAWLMRADREPVWAPSADHPENTPMPSALNVCHLRAQQRASMACAPERLFQIIKERTRTHHPVTSLLACLDASHPNVNHRTLARFVTHGLRFIVTTNFDTYIEQSLDAEGLRRGLDYGVLCSSPDYVAYLAQKCPPDALVVKIHGSLAEPSSLVTSIDQVNRVLSPELSALLTHIFRDRSILYWGYSARDPDILDKLAAMAARVEATLFGVYGDEPLSAQLPLLAPNGRTFLVASRSLLTELSQEILGSGLDAPDSPTSTPSTPAYTDHIERWADDLRPHEAVGILWDIFSDFGLGGLLQADVEEMASKLGRAGRSETTNDLDNVAFVIKYAEKLLDPCSGAEHHPRAEALLEELLGHRLATSTPARIDYQQHAVRALAGPVTDQLIRRLESLSSGTGRIEDQVTAGFGAAYFYMITEKWSKALKSLGHALYLVERDELLVTPGLGSRVGMLCEGVINKSTGRRLYIRFGTTGETIQSLPWSAAVRSMTPVNYPLALLHLDSLSMYYYWYAVTLECSGQHELATSYALRGESYPAVLARFLPLYLDHAADCCTWGEWLALFHLLLAAYLRGRDDGQGVAHHEAVAAELLPGARDRFRGVLAHLTQWPTVQTMVTLGSSESVAGILGELGHVFAPGQIWAFEKEPHEYGTVKILRIEYSDIVGVIIHVRVFANQIWRAEDLPPSYPLTQTAPTVGHLPVVVDAFARSVDFVCGCEDVTDGELEGYRIWLRAFEERRAGVFGNCLQECLKMMRIRLGGA